MIKRLLISDFKPSNYSNLMEGGNRQSKANEGERLFVKGSHLVFFYYLLFSGGISI